MELDYNSLASLCRAAQDAGQPFSQLILASQAEQMDVSPDVLYQEMQARYQVMTQSVENGMQANVRSTSGLTGGDAFKVNAMADGQTLCGVTFTRAIARALAVSEWNAAMGRIVAAPTAGSCGILPAALLTMQQDNHCGEKACVMSLFTAGAIGMIIGANACLAGAQGGCQAECGSAAAMAAGALVELAGGTPAMIENAVAIALKNVMGLVCDPVAGLVEIPCIKRNASGIANAFTAAQMALADVKSAIPADEVIIAMKRVGDAMPDTLKETAEGGLAATPTGKKLFEQVFHP